MLHEQRAATWAFVLFLVATCAQIAHCQQQQSPPASALPHYRLVNGTVTLSVTEHTLSPDALLVDLSTVSSRASTPSSQQVGSPTAGSSGAGTGFEYILKSESVRPESARDTITLRQATLRLSSAVTTGFDRESICPRSGGGGSGQQLHAERIERSPYLRYDLCPQICPHHVSQSKWMFGLVLDYAISATALMQYSGDLVLHEQHISVV